MQTSFWIAWFTHHMDGFFALMGIHFTPQIYQTPGLKPLLCDDNHIKKDVGEKKVKTGQKLFIKKTKTKGKSEEKET